MPSKYFPAWEKIFEEKNFDLRKDLHYISADDIKKITGLEPRVMAKFDSTKNLPDVLKRNGYFILPMSTKQYAIVRGSGYHEVESQTHAVNFESRISFALSTMHRNKSESQYLDHSFNSGLVEHIVNRGRLYQSIRGREGSGTFNFRVGQNQLHVESAQMEIDAGFEGEDCIVLFEAKVNTPADFNIRQLYYPYRKFHGLYVEKEVIPIFFTYDPKDEEYNFWQYRIPDTHDYNSISLVKTYSFTISAQNIVRPEDIEPAGVVYKGITPQANNLDRVIELIFKVKEGIGSAKDIAKVFGIEPRQGNYYREAAEALGLIVSAGENYRLTESGEYLTSLPVQERNIYFAKIVSGFELIRRALDIVNAEGSISRQQLERLIEEKGSVGGSTVPRRASSLLSWLRWIAKNTGAYYYEEDAIRLK